MYILHQEVYTKSVLKSTCNSTFTLQGVNLLEYGVPMEATNLHQIGAGKHCQVYVYSQSVNLHHFGVPMEASILH